MGKQTLLGIFAVSSLAAIAWRATPDQAPIIAIGAVVVVLVIAVLNFIFAHRHPVEATLEGTEVVALQQQAMAAKTFQIPANSPVIPNPGAPLPAIEPPREPEQ